MSEHLQAIVGYVAALSLLVTGVLGWSATCEYFANQWEESAGDWGEYAEEYAALGDPANTRECRARVRRCLAIADGYRKQGAPYRLLRRAAGSLMERRILRRVGKRK